MDTNLKEALLKLDVDNDNHWTEQGLPRIETLKFLTGDVSITRESINNVAPGFTRSNSVIAETVVLQEPIAYTLAMEFDDAQAELEGLVQEFGRLQNLVFEKTKEVHALAEQVENSKPVETSQTAIQSYLKSEQAVLEERGVRLEMIARSGLKLKDLAENLNSPLDASLARKR